jgi:hypothetical protein
MGKMWIALFLCLYVLTGLVLSGCEQTSQDETRGKDIEYTVVPTADCPEEFKNEIENKKINAFEMTYDDGEYLYLATGYGEQESGGFSISVTGLYELGEKICLETSLQGPSEDEVVSGKESYPYLVVKIERIDKEVVFEP